MILPVVLAVVLGLALLGAVAALVVTERRKRAVPWAASAAVRGREALDVIDLGLRKLAGECARAGRALPDVYAVVYSEERLKLLLSRADSDAPQSWTSEEGGECWSMTPARLETSAPGGPGRKVAGEPDAPPYAMVVTVGLDGGERVLVDLSRAPSSLAVTGSEEEARKLARAFVAEVITGPVGGTAEVTLVGAVATEAMTAGSSLRSSRLHTVATLREAVDRVPEALRGPSPKTAEVTQIFRLIEGQIQITEQAGTPRLFVLDAAQLAEEKAVLERLEASDTVLVLGDTAETGWRLKAGPDGSLDTGPLGLQIDTHAGRFG